MAARKKKLEDLRSHSDGTAVLPGGRFALRAHGGLVSVTPPAAERLSPRAQRRRDAEFVATTVVTGTTPVRGRTRSRIASGSRGGDPTGQRGKGKPVIGFLSPATRLSTHLAHGNSLAVGVEDQLGHSTGLILGELDDDAARDIEEPGLGLS